MKNTAAIALLLARTSAQDVSRDRAFNPPKMIADAAMTTCTDDKTKVATTNKTTADSALVAAQKELTTAEALVTTETAAQVTAIKAVAAEDLKNKKLLDDDRAAVLEALRLRIAMNAATRAKTAATTAKQDALNAFNAAKTASENATTLKTAADKAVVQAFNHCTWEKAQLTTAATNVGTTQGEYVANHGSTNATEIDDPAVTGGKISTMIPEVVTGTASAPVVPANVDGTLKLTVNAGIKAPASPVAGTKGDLAAKKSTNDSTKGENDSFLATTKAAWDIKETLLTAYCVQSIAFGVVNADMLLGKEVSASYTMGNGGKGDAITELNADLRMGGSTGAAPQLGVLKAGSTDPVYKCAIPLKDNAGKVTNDPVIPAGQGVQKPGDLSTNTARLTDCVNDPVIKATSGSCAAVTLCEWNAGACRQKASELVKLPKQAFEKTITDALALADGQCTAKKLKSDDTADVAVYDETACPKNQMCVWSTSCKYKSAHYQGGSATLQGNASISKTYKDWRDLSNATMDAFGAMITSTNAMFTNVTNGDTKVCDNSMSGIVVTAMDATNFKDVIQYDGSKVGALADLGTVDNAKCKKACSALPGLKAYTTDGQCNTATTACCMGYSWTASTCKFLTYTSDTNIAAAGGNGAGGCYKRNYGAGKKTKLWNTAAKLSISDTQASEWTGSVATDSKYALYLAKLTLYTDKRVLVFAAAEKYYNGKRLNMKMAAAYKTSYDVYRARYAQYNGANSDFSPAAANAKKVKYDTAKGLYDSAVTANDTKKKAYEAAVADFKANRTELMNQMLILKAAMADAATAKSAETAAKATYGTAKAGNTAATGEFLKKDTADADYTKKDGDSTKATSAHTEYTKVGGTLLTAQSAATAAKSSIKKLRDAANTAAGKTKAAAIAAGGKRATVALKVADVAAKQVLLDAAIQACKETKWDAYKATLAKAESDREKDITTITTLLKDNKAKAPKVDKGAGAKGARCEKALTQGAAGPKRGAGTCQTPETNCCGAAKKLDAVTGLLMTVEVCWPKADKKYKYQPPRGPMKTTMPATEDDWDFACIEGAQKLVAATAALATAAYMMA